MTAAREYGRGPRILVALYRYLSFFLLTAFLVTCCMLLFLQNLEGELLLTEANIHRAAVLTFVNVLFLSLLFTVINAVQRRFTVERPVRKIADAAKKMMQGDWSVKVDKVPSLDPGNELNIVIGYINQMAEELAGVETLRTDFIANVSHELKTPLAVIQNYGTLLQSPDLPEKQRLEYAKAITDTSRTLSVLISNILKLNKLENQQVYPNVQVYNLGEQLCECLLTFEDLWEKKDIEIETDIEEEVYVESDQELLTLVWNNLFSNALKFTEPGGTLSLRLRSDGGCALVEVADTGCGISPETGKHIFEKFYQGDTSHATKGNGLGLALVKRVVDIVGSDISVSSEVGKGSTFTVKIRRVEHGAAEKDTA